MKGGVDMKVQTGTIVRTVVLLFALFNQLLTAAGKNPLPFSEVGNITKAVSKGRDFCPLWFDETFRAFGRLSAHA